MEVKEIKEEHNSLVNEVESSQESELVEKKNNEIKKEKICGFRRTRSWARREKEKNDKEKIANDEIKSELKTLNFDPEVKSSVGDLQYEQTCQESGEVDFPADPDVIEYSDDLPTMIKRLNKPFPIMKSKILEKYKQKNLLKPNMDLENEATHFSPYMEEIQQSEDGSDSVCLMDQINKEIKILEVHGNNSKELARLRQQRRRNSWSPNRLKEERAKQAARRRAARASMAPELRDYYRARNREHQRKLRAKMSPEQLKISRAKNAERQRIARAAMTTEQRQAERARHAARNRMRRAERRLEQALLTSAVNEQAYFETVESLIKNEAPS